jgi:hypothetical protein
MNSSVQGRLTSLVLLGTFALTGCVSTKTNAVDHKALAAFRGATVVTTQRERPAFAAMTAGKAAFGALGGASMVVAGNNIIRDNDIPDPAVKISQALLTEMTSDNELHPVAGSVTTSSMDAEKLSQEYGASAQLLLDVQTVNWSFVYFPTDWSHYRVLYRAKMRLIDTKHSKLLADGFCNSTPEKSDSSPTKEQLLDNNAAGLKQELATATAFCVQEFRTKVLEKS